MREEARNLFPSFHHPARRNQMTIVKNTAKAKAPTKEETPKSAAKEELKKVKLPKEEAKAVAEEATEEEEQEAVVLGRAQVIEAMRAKVKEAGAAIPPNTAGITLTALEDVISEALQQGNEVRLGIGKFVVVYREAREGRNPKTGEAVDIAESWSPKFKPSQTLKRFVNQTGDEEAEGEEAEEAEAEDEGDEE